MPAWLTKVVLDVLKPRELSLPDLARAICEEAGTERVSADIVEVDVRTETVKLTVEGYSIDMDLLLGKLEELGCAVRSIDSVTARRVSSEKTTEGG